MNYCKLGHEEINEKLRDETSLFARMAGSQYFQQYNTLCNLYANLRPAVRQSIAFVPHEYPDHCVNMIMIIDSMFRDYNSEYDIGKWLLNVEHLFLLYSAVLVHDMIMGENIQERNKHASLGAERLLLDKDKLIASIDEKHLKCIALIAKAHSDDKDENGNIIQENFHEVVDSLEKYTGARRKIISTRKDEFELDYKSLAAFLRLVDELDICKDRLSCIKNIPRQEMNLSSINHWRKCQLFEKPEFDVKNKVIKLIVDADSVGKSEVFNSEVVEFAFDEDISRIIEVYEKIESTLELITKKYLVTWPDIYGVDFKYERITIHYVGQSISSVKKAVERKLKYYGPEHICHYYEKRYEDGNSTYKTFIKELVENDAYITGHFSIDKNDKECVKDWINVKKVLRVPSLKKQVIDGLKKVLSKYDEDEILLIGIDIQGAVLASYMSLYAGYSFDYIIPKKNEGNHCGFEVTSKLREYKKFILLSDVIVSYGTIKDTIRLLLEQYRYQSSHIEEERNDLSNDCIMQIVSAFYRKSNLSQRPGSKELRKKTTVVFECFEIAMCSDEYKAKCPIREYDLYDN